MASNCDMKIIPLDGDAMAGERKRAFNIVVVGVSVVIVSSVLLQLANLKALANLKFKARRPRSRFARLPIATLRLNTEKPLTCPRVLMLRTPKTASSALASLFFLRRAAAGDNCSRTYFPTGRYLPPGAYTLNTTTIARVPRGVLHTYITYIAHMNYTPALRRALDETRFFRLTSVRDARARADSLFAYEVDRPHIELRPALEYLGAPRLPPAASTRDVLSPALPDAAVRAQIVAAMRHWHLVVVAEQWDKSLAVLMYALHWRLVDVLAPPLNMQHPAAKKAALAASHAYRIARPEDEARLKWTLDVDTKLYRRAVHVLEHRFKRLPKKFRDVPRALRRLRKTLAKECPTRPEQKHFTKKDIQCLRKFRRSLLRAAGVVGWAR